MMKKVTTLSLMALLASPSFADSMGNPDYVNPNTAFFSLEAAYTRNSIDGFAFSILGTDSTVLSLKDNQWYSGRIAGGMLNRVNDTFALSGELGWGYYGRTNLNPVGTGVFAASPDIFRIQNTITGFDVLMGAFYTQPCYNLFLKAGALIENVNTTTNASLNLADFTTNNSFSWKQSSTEALPEIKVGGSYLFNENWALTVAYFHAFGSDQKTVGTVDPITGTTNFSVNVENPSLDSVLVGIQVSI